MLFIATMKDWEKCFLVRSKSRNEIKSPQRKSCRKKEFVFSITKYYNEMRRLIVACAAFAFFASCSQQQPSADKIYINAKIWTGDTANDRATAIAIKDSLIVYVGNDYINYKGSNTQIIDVDGKMVVPGFTDNHTHFLGGGYQLASVNLRNVKTQQDFISTLKAFATAHNDDRWILGGDWDHEAWGGNLPTRQWIDSISGKHPVFIDRYDGHMALANSLALKLAHVDKNTPNPPGGEIVKDPKTGDPTGVLKDGAKDFVEMKVIPPPTQDE